MNFIQSKEKEFDNKFVIDLAQSINPQAVDVQTKVLYPNEADKLKSFLRTSLEEYKKELENTPMGVSQWKNIGKKYGYWDYFKK